MNKSDFLPSVTVTMISYQDETIIETCLRSIREQDYPQDKVVIQLIDGGSTDRTADIAEKYGAIFKSMPELKDYASQRGGLAITTPSTELGLFFSADNRFGSPLTLSKMVAAYLETKPLGVSTLRYAHVRDDRAISRYFALNGGTDPLVVFLRLNDRLAYDEKSWGIAFDADQYEFGLLANFSSFRNFPTIGANGFLYPTNMYKNSRYASDGLHIDMAYEASRTSKGGFAFVEGETIHHCIDTSVIAFVKRRVQYAGDYQFAEKRLYKIFDSHSAFWCIVFAIYSITFIFPILRAIKGYFSKQDKAWFLHPIICFAFTVGYSSFAYKMGLKKCKEKLRLN